MGGVFTKYPCQRYHKELAPEGRTVTSPEAEAALGAGWVDTFFFFVVIYSSSESTLVQRRVVVPSSDGFPAFRFLAL